MLKIKSHISLVLAVMMIMALALSGCSSDTSSAPEEYNYDDFSKFIKLGEYKGITYDKADVDVSDEDVMEYIDGEVENTAVTSQNTTGTVKEDSVVNMDYVGSIDGVEFEGGTAQNQELDIANSTYIAGFAEALVGHKAGETFDIDVTFPEDYGSAELAGKDAVFRITLNYISEKTVPEYNDEWVASNTEYKTTAEYEESVKKQLAEDKESEASNSERLQVFNTIMDSTEVIEYPETEYDARYNKIINTYKSNAMNSGVEWETYLSEQMGMTEEQFESAAKSSAEEAVKRELILYDIADLESIELTDDGYNDYLLGLLEDAGYTEKSYEEEKGITIQEYAEENNLYTGYLYQCVMDKVMEYSAAE